MLRIRLKVSYSGFCSESMSTSFTTEARCGQIKPAKYQVGPLIRFLGDSSSTNIAAFKDQDGTWSAILEDTATLTSAHSSSSLATCLLIMEDWCQTRGRLRHRKSLNSCAAYCNVLLAFRNFAYSSKHGFVVSVVRVA